MNPIFTVIFILSSSVFLFIDPNGFLKAMTDGGTKAVSLSLSLLVVYAVWSGFLQIADDCGLNDKIAALLRPLIEKLFKKPDKDTIKYISLNMSANLLGMGGIATPAGIEAMKRLGESGDKNGSCMLFVIAATSIQILPTTVISLRQSFGSNDPFDIFLPSLLSTVVSTVIGVALCLLTAKRKKV